MFLFTLVIALAVLVIVVVSLAFATIGYHLFVLRCPYVPTSRSVARAMVAFARLKGTERVYDLGAGDGVVLIEAKKAHPGITGIGIELVPTVWLIGKIRIWLSGTKVDLRRGNAFTAHVADADVIFLYLVPHVMEVLGKKFETELRPGTVIISHAFEFPGREATEKMVTEKGERLHRYVWE